LKSKLNLVITGLPRSGTSLLCARVNDFKNAVVLNEPAEVFGALRGGSVEGLLSIFSQYRDDIEQGKPVANKIKNGNIISDSKQSSEINLKSTISKNTSPIIILHIVMHVIKFNLRVR